MMKTFSRLIFVGIFLCLYSCSGINKAVKGSWSITKIEYQEENIFYDLLSNMIFFERKECILPRFDQEHSIQAKREGTWKVSKEGEQYFITIDTKNEIFAGKHKICFKKNLDKKLIVLVISSENLYVECEKWLFNFYKDHQSIDDYLCK